MRSINDRTHLGFPNHLCQLCRSSPVTARHAINFIHNKDNLLAFWCNCFLLAKDGNFPANSYGIQLIQTYLICLLSLICPEKFRHGSVIKHFRNVFLHIIQ